MLSVLLWVEITVSQFFLFSSYAPMCVDFPVVHSFPVVHFFFNFIDRAWP